MLGLQGVAWRLVLIAWLALPGPTEAQRPFPIPFKDTPLGVELVGANYPDSTTEETVLAVALAAQMGSHVMFTWNWGNRSFIDGSHAVIEVAQLQELLVFLQIGTTFLGNPDPPGTLPPSFADEGVRGLYLQDVRTLAELKPDYLVMTTEANIMYRFNNEEFHNFKTLYAEAYQLVKSISPETKVGASFLYGLWFVQRFIDGEDVPSQLEPRDFIAFTSYPAWLLSDGHYERIADIPASWYGLGRTAYPDAEIVFSEVGWASTGKGSELLQAQYMANLPRLMSEAKPSHVTWALLHDVDFFGRGLLTQEDLDFLLGLGVDIDLLFEHFNGTGIRYPDGSPKPAWFQALDLVFDYANPAP